MCFFVCFSIFMAILFPFSFRPICNFGYGQPSLKISCKSVWEFLRKVSNRQTNRQTDRQINNDETLAEVNINYTFLALL